MADRSLWRAAQKIIRERDALRGMVGEIVREWTSASPRPDQALFSIPPSPLSPQDSEYLIELIRSGSQAEMARVSGVSRAAVTQRIQRIRRRIAELSRAEQDTAETWLRHTAVRIAAGGEVP
ncbi:MAG: hypothetical protein ACI8S6_005708 [Myxococcota bacterium]